MRYAVARYNQNQRDTAYRIYVTDTLRIISRNTGAYAQKRFIEILDPKCSDDRTGEEIAVDVIKSAGLEVVS